MKESGVMKGWIYKELRQSWVFLISAFVFGLFPLLNIWILDNTLKYVERSAVYLSTQKKRLSDLLTNDRNRKQKQEDYR